MTPMRAAIVTAGDRWPGDRCGNAGRKARLDRDCAAARFGGLRIASRGALALAVSDCQRHAVRRGSGLWARLAACPGPIRGTRGRREADREADSSIIASPFPAATSWKNWPRASTRWPEELAISKQKSERINAPEAVSGAAGCGAGGEFRPGLLGWTAARSRRRVWRSARLHRVFGAGRA